MAAATCLYRCRKCREIVFDSKCLVTVHGQQNNLSGGSAVLPSVSCQDVSTETVWYVTADSAPKWILNNIEMALWTKGKLLCPKCEGRLGSFDFTKIVKCSCRKFKVPPIHILQCRVDEISTASSTQEILRNRQSKIIAKDISVDPSNEAEQKRGMSSSPEEIFSLNIPIPFDPKMVQVDTNSAVTFDPNLTSTQDNDSASFLPSSKMTSSRSFDRVNVDTLTPGAERSFREADPDSGQRSLVDGSYSSPFTSERTRSFVGKELREQSTSESDVHLKFVMDQSNGNRKDVKKGVKESRLKGDNPQQTGNQQQESHEMRMLPDEVEATNTGDYLESGHSLNALPVCQGQRDVSDDERPSNAEQPVILAQSRCDVLGDEHRHAAAPRRTKQRNGRRRGKTKAVTDYDQNDDVDPVYPEEHTCPLCLDLYCYPMRTSPCDHVFCDTCLRHLARATPVNTPCPLCRQVISKCHGEGDLARDLKTWYSARYKKRQVMENKFRKDSYHKLPQLNPATLRLPNTDRLGQDPWQQFIRERNPYNRMGVNLPSARYVLYSFAFIAVMLCHTVYRFSVELASLPLSTALVVTGLVFIALMVVTGLLVISQVVKVVGSVSQVFGQAIVQFVGSVFLSPRVESFRAETSESLLPSSIRLRAMTANFFLVVIVVLICRYVFFRRVMVQLRRNV